ncbi:hypothetical protein SAMN05421866_4205 [Chryseobacterium oranimense]|uniref:Uncharacterized protein n=1 Tax=Chryseobacterium oranimense TaxID=421058 RepID=A0A1M5WT26_9FLAO|nr:hypothetical protein [Chryseobacterium oranimense]SHH90183.1 hypothetical protein SAMN05421866_4205 [Chryseobacterium oranimense]
MTKEEQLKIYSAYLPYGLELQHKYEKAKHEGESVLRSWVKPLEPLDLGCLFPHRKDSFDWKPILYDLSYLSKEIEHEGVKVIPIDYISLSKANSQRIMRRYANGQSLDVLEQWQFERLLQLHLNVFNLPEDQFINKATLTNK